MKVLMMSGKMGSGKTSLQVSVGDAWLKTNSYASVEVFKFADVLYEMHDAVLEVLHNYWPKRAIPKDGKLLQLLGTDWARETIDENIWVKILEKRMQELRFEYPEVRLYENLLVIIDDCRFENEFDALPLAYRVRLLCPEHIRKDRCSNWRENTTHPSEVGLDKLSDENRFDLYLHTDEYNVEFCADRIMDGLKKWTDRKTVIRPVEAQT